MKRKSIVRGGGEDENGDGGTTKKHSSSSNNKRKNDKTNLPPPPVIGTVATRTRRQQKEIATKWNEPIPILIHIMSYADPETIRMLCCVSKQFHDLITNNPGMEYNRVVPPKIKKMKDESDDCCASCITIVINYSSTKKSRSSMCKNLVVLRFLSGWN